MLNEMTRMIEWIESTVEKWKSIHCGCIWDAGGNRCQFHSFEFWVLNARERRRLEVFSIKCLRKTLRMFHGSDLEL